MCVCLWAKTGLVTNHLKVSWAYTCKRTIFCAHWIENLRLVRQHALAPSDFNTSSAKREHEHRYGFPRFVTQPHINQPNGQSCTFSLKTLVRNAVHKKNILSLDIEPPIHTFYPECRGKTLLQSLRPSIYWISMWSQIGENLEQSMVIKQAGNTSNIIVPLLFGTPNTAVSFLGRSFSVRVPFEGLCQASKQIIVEKCIFHYENSWEGSRRAHCVVSSSHE